MRPRSQALSLPGSGVNNTVALSQGGRDVSRACHALESDPDAAFSRGWSGWCRSRVPPARDFPKQTGAGRK